MKHKFIVRYGRYLVLFFSVSTAQITLFDQASLFPDTQYVAAFSADDNAHRMRIETIELTRNMRASMGTIFPIADIDIFDVPLQASIGASVHFEVRPDGQAHIVSDEYYVDYFILDALLTATFALRFASGHTSHHLSDNWYERLHLSSAFHYARDYVKVYGVYSDKKNLTLYAGVNYGYIVTIKQRLAKPWIVQAGSEISIASLFDFLTLYYAGDAKIRQEAGFAATVSHQIGLKFIAPYSRNLRVAYQFRHGLDERGQFFPQHRTLNTVGIYFDM